MLKKRHCVGNKNDWRSHLQFISIATGVVRVNNLNILKECSSYLVLTDKWVKGVLEKPAWNKREGTAGKVDPSL